jgi:sialic acid synthase SpsE
MFETHFSVTLGAGGDHDFAAGSEVLERIVHIAKTHTAGIGTGQLSPSPAEADARLQARRSLYASVDIPKGKRLEKADLVALRPGTGIPPADIDKIVNIRQARSMRAMVDIPAGTQLTWKMIGFVGATLTVK